MKKLLCILILFAGFAGCRQEPGQQSQFNNGHISQVILKMTDMMVHDVTNPPLAARFFSYASLAGYEVVSQNDSTIQSMYGLLNDYPKLEKPVGIKNYAYQLSALLAMMETAKKMQPSGTMMEEYEQQFLDSCRTMGFSEEVIENSLLYAQEISKDILAYAKADKYNRISNYPRYTPSDQEGDWYPTPPGYFAPVEPYFNTIRSFTLDTCNQFKPIPPVVFSMDKDSEFHYLMTECYKAGNNLTDEQKQIAAFWDCNPFALQENGHLMVGVKKISPGAHWLGIAGIACKKADVDFSKTLEINTMVAISLMDGFISCWDEKFSSNRIRPETVIRKYIDPSYTPLLQTPPFPEYLSGHSTISAASAVILTHYFGDNFNYTDTVEERYGLSARNFDSFQQAAIEAGLSRFYGGIHYMDAIDQGRVQGLEVGEWILSKTKRKADSDELAGN